MRSGVVHGARMSIAAFALVLAGASGCTYLKNRGADAKQMMDLGFTFSKKPQFGLYANCPMVTPVGYSKVDGYFVGMGGGKLGAGEHHQNNAGALLWGREENSWKGFKDDKATVESHKAGFVGIAQNAKEGRKPYKPACIHYLHLGYVGIMWNLNYHKMADFFCGWFGYIPFGDRNEAAATRVAKAAEPPKVAAAPAAPTPAAVAAASPAPRPPAKVASAPPTPPPAPPAQPAKPAKADRAPEAPLPPLPPDEIALAVARDLAAAKAELAAARQAKSPEKPAKLVAGGADEAPANPPQGRFPIEHLVP
ncbi:MAG: hypothetical protein FJ290_27025 [Planctomycetes bacterium]|nr:hypothetical protein [Planctomycetota bacterium]